MSWPPRCKIISPQRILSQNSTKQQTFSSCKHSFGTYFIIEHMDNHHNLHPTKIIMYSTQYCPDCMRAKAFFEANNIPYDRVLLEGNEEATEFVIKMNNGFRSVPTILFPDGSVLVEPTWQELKEKTSK